MFALIMFIRALKYVYIEKVFYIIFSRTQDQYIIKNALLQSEEREREAKGAGGERERMSGCHKVENKRERYKKKREKRVNEWGNG